MVSVKHKFSQITETTHSGKEKVKMIKKIKEKINRNWKQLAVIDDK